MILLMYEKLLDDCCTSQRDKNYLWARTFPNHMVPERRKKKEKQERDGKGHTAEIGGEMTKQGGDAEK